MKRDSADCRLHSTLRLATRATSPPMLRGSWWAAVTRLPVTGQTKVTETR